MSSNSSFGRIFEMDIPAALTRISTPACQIVRIGYHAGETYIDLNLPFPSQARASMFQLRLHPRRLGGLDLMMFPCRC